jgi:UDP-2,4-diacetamido-2,4,6-trideoxy-beta-L-altropyranose hydrolase
MRTLALGQEWQDQGGTVTLVTKMEVSRLEERIHGEGFRLYRLEVEPGSPADVRETARVATGMEARWVVVDGYEFGAGYQQMLRDQGLKVLLIDDHGQTGGCGADLVLDQNLSAEEGMYAGCEPCRGVLLGPRFALIRREFREAGRRQREIPSITRNVLVTMGGADPGNATLTVLQTLEELGGEGTRITVVVGEANPHGEMLEERILGRPSIRLVRGGETLASVFADADAAISGGGSTTLELLYLGVPFLTVVLAPNQAPVAQALEVQGFTRILGEAEHLEPAFIAGELRRFFRAQEERRRFSEAGRRLVDGEGAARVVMRLRGDPLRVMLAKADDCHNVLEWANDPVVRAASFHPDPIPVREHEVWFARMIRDEQTLFLIAVDGDDRPAGQVRFAIKDRTAEVHYSISREFRGRGMGVHLLEAGLRTLVNRRAVQRVYGAVKVDNLPSIRSFEGAGFSRRGSDVLHGSDIYWYERVC